MVEKFVVEKPVVAIDDIKRIAWHSRRGMLELDLILMPFVEKHYSQLDKAQQQAYVQLLACEDQDLFGWFLQHQQSQDPVLQGMVELILERHHRA